MYLVRGTWYYISCNFCVLFRLLFASPTICTLKHIYFFLIFSDFFNCRLRGIPCAGGNVKSACQFCRTGIRFARSWWSSSHTRSELPQPMLQLYVQYISTVRTSKSPFCVLFFFFLFSILCATLCAMLCSMASSVLCDVFHICIVCIVCVP